MEFQLLWPGALPGTSRKHPTACVTVSDPSNLLMLGGTPGVRPTFVSACHPPRRTRSYMGYYVPTLSWRKGKNHILERAQKPSPLFFLQHPVRCQLRSFCGSHFPTCLTDTISGTNLLLYWRSSKHTTCDGPTKCALEERNKTVPAIG